MSKFLPALARHSGEETVSQFVIPAEFRKTGRDPGSISSRYDAVFLDSGSLYSSRRSSGMMFFGSSGKWVPV